MEKHKVVQLDSIAIAGPNLNVNFAQAKMMPQSKEDQEKFITKYIIGIDPDNDSRREDGNNPESSQESSK